MWAKPAAMAEMLETKGAQPQAGANCAWVPSPTAATLHALHYLRTDVLARQRELAGRDTDRRLLLEVPVLRRATLSDEEKRHELETNAQSILGYVVRWVGLGIGCSTVPDLAGVGLMEDRATLRISSQLIANWLHHGLVDEAQVRDTFARMAEVVDEQNAGEPGYRPMAKDLDGNESFQAALELVFTGRTEPNGYTERALTSWRQRAKSCVSVPRRADCRAQPASPSPGRVRPPGRDPADRRAAGRLRRALRRRGRHPARPGRVRRAERLLRASVTSTGRPWPAADGGPGTPNRTTRTLRDGDAEIKRMYVVASHRGRGIARAVLAELERAAAAAGRRRMVLETGDRQPEAVALYTSSGYRPVDRFGKLPRRAGLPVFRQGHRQQRARSRLERRWRSGCADGGIDTGPSRTRSGVIATEGE